MYGKVVPDNFEDWFKDEKQKDGQNTAQYITS